MNLVVTLGHITAVINIRLARDDRGGITRQARAQETVELMGVAVAGGVQSAYQAILLQVAIVLPFTADAQAIRSEFGLSRMGGADLSTMAHKTRRRRLDARALR